MDPAWAPVDAAHFCLYTVSVPERPQFDWDEANVGHIARHGVTPEEAEQVISGDPLVIGSNLYNGELRTVCLGRTGAGRPLTVVHTIRNQRIRVVTAYPVKRRKTKIYESG
jgi:hypothetical protein